MDVSTYCVLRDDFHSFDTTVSDFTSLVIFSHGDIEFMVCVDSKTRHATVANERTAHEKASYQGNAIQRVISLATKWNI